jgi:uridine kinase
MENIVNKLIFLSTRKNSVLVAIDGIPGGGKTSLGKYLEQKIPKIKQIKMDYFFDPLIGDVNFEGFKKEVLIPLKNNRTASFKIYNWHQNKFMDVLTIKPGGIILIEGTSSMDRRLVSVYDYRIWVDCPRDIGLKRVLKRDKRKYRRTWIDKWMPEIVSYIEKQKPYEKADVIISYKDIHE